MKIAVVGVGGVGGYFGGRLAKAGFDTTFIARGATLAALKERGLRVESIKGDFQIEPVQVTSDPTTVGLVDAILFTVKAWQLAEAAESVRPMIGPDTIAVPLENGLEASGDLAAVLGENHVLGGLCGIVSFVVEPGHIRHTGAEPLILLGELDNRRSERAERFCAALQAAGIQAEIPIDIQRSLWTKFLFIAPFGAIGALCRAPVGVWRATGETRALAVRAMEEVLALATVSGVRLDPDAIAMTLARYDGLPPLSTSSLQRDIVEGKPSELQAQVGAVVRMARAHGLTTPVFDTTYALLLTQEKKARGVSEYS